METVHVLKQVAGKVSKVAKLGRKILNLEKLANEYFRLGTTSWQTILRLVKTWQDFHNLAVSWLVILQLGKKLAIWKVRYTWHFAPQLQSSAFKSWYNLSNYTVFYIWLFEEPNLTIKTIKIKDMHAHKFNIIFRSTIHRRYIVPFHAQNMDCLSPFGRWEEWSEEGPV